MVFRQVGQEEGSRMHTKRIIPCLDVKDGRVVKGINFVNLQDAGDPAEVSSAYDKAGADEVVFLDITASADNRATHLAWVREVASKVFIPFTVGGGIRTVEDFKALLREGADKISVNSAANVWWLPLTRNAEKMAAAGISIRTADALIWVWMPWNGQKQ